MIWPKILQSKKTKVCKGCKIVQKKSEKYWKPSCMDDYSSILSKNIHLKIVTHSPSRYWHSLSPLLTQVSKSFLSQFGFGRGKSGKALFLSTKYHGALWWKCFFMCYVCLSDICVMGHCIVRSVPINMFLHMFLSPDIVIPGYDSLYWVSHHVYINRHLNVIPGNKIYEMFKV